MGAAASDSGMCLSKTASVSACILDVAVGKPSFGQGRGVIMYVVTISQESEFEFYET